MALSALLGAAAIAVGVLGTAAADPLVGAFLGRERAEVARLGQLAAARGLEPGLVSPDRATALAAIAAAPAADDGWELLMVLSDLAAGADRPIAVDAALAARAIAADLAVPRVEDREVPREEIARQLEAWRALGQRPDRWADVRVLALEVSAELSAVAGGPPDYPAFDLELLAADPDVQIRRAAYELLRAPLSEQQRSLLGRAAAGDADELTALSAAQALCSGIAFGDSERLAREALDDAGIQRVRLLVADHALPVRARIDAAHCIADGDWQNRAAIERLVNDTPQTWRASVRALARPETGAPP